MRQCNPLLRRPGACLIWQAARRAPTQCLSGVGAYCQIKSAPDQKTLGARELYAARRAPHSSSSRLQSSGCSMTCSMHSFSLALPCDYISVYPMYHCHIMCTPMICP